MVIDYVGSLKGFRRNLDDSQQLLVRSYMLFRLPVTLSELGRI